MIRRAYLAGQWYPGERGLCGDAILGHLRFGEPAKGDFRAVVVPHAGWFYSGDAMGAGYQSLLLARPSPEVVVVFGSHRGPKGPNTVFAGTGWETPLGVIKTRLDLVKSLKAAEDLFDEPIESTTHDNAVEVQLPFIRYCFPNASLLMVGVEASPRGIELGRVVGEQCRERGIDAVFVGSTDLTHYGQGYGFAPKGSGEEAVEWVRTQNDRGFLDFLVEREYGKAVEDALLRQSACCPGAAVAALAARDAFEGAPEAEGPRLITHYLSCDVRSAPDFVGYGTLVY